MKHSIKAAIKASQLIPATDPQAKLIATMNGIEAKHLGWPTEDKRAFRGALQMIIEAMVPGDNADSVFIIEDSICIFPASYTQARIDQETADLDRFDAGIDLDEESCIFPDEYIAGRRALIKKHRARIARAQKRIKPLSS